MANSNVELRKDKRAKERALLDRIGAEKRTLIVSKARTDAIQVLGERHDCDEWQETASRFLINLAAAPAEESARFASMSRPEIVVTAKWSPQLDEFAQTRIEAGSCTT